MFCHPKSRSQLAVALVPTPIKLDTTAPVLEHGPWPSRADKLAPMRAISRARILIVEARFYDDIADELLKGATRVLEAAGAVFDRVSVPGSLEIPPAITIALDAAEKAGKPYEGAVALGCVIRGDTIHFEIVSHESARGLMDISRTRGVPIGNGILTVDNDAQAWMRARVEEGRQGRRRRARGARAGAAQAPPGVGLTAMARDGAPNERKANRRGAARLAAVQALYQMDIAGTGLNDILAEFESHWIGREVEGEQYLPAEAAFFRDVVGGVVREQRKLDPLIDAALAQKLAAQAHRGDAARGPARRRLRARPPARRAGARGGVGICRRRPRLRRARGDRHGQCRARSARAQLRAAEFDRGGVAPWPRAGPGRNRPKTA